MIRGKHALKPQPLLYRSFSPCAFQHILFKPVQLVMAAGVTNIHMENIMFEQYIGMSLYEALGLAGVAFYLGSYAALQFDFIDAKGFAYPTLNFLAASFVLLSLLENYNFPSLLIQISWIAISLYGISKLLFAKSRSDQQTKVA